MLIFHFVQMNELVMDVAKGIEVPHDVLARIFEDLLQVLDPLCEDTQHGGVAG
jgi:hypothetical protein